jgi:iron complex transport system permease protein
MTYIKKKNYYKFIMLLSFAALAGVIVYSAFAGAANISFLQALKVIIKKIPFLSELVKNEEIPRVHEVIITKVRLPRIIMAGIIGAGLSVVGSSFQSMFRNPMADPYVMGVSHGAALGAAIAIIIGSFISLSVTVTIPVFAFTGAILATILVFTIAKTGQRIPTNTLLLAGIAFGLFSMSMITIIMVFNRTKLETIVFWLMGSVSGAKWSELVFMLPVVAIGVFILISLSKTLNVMSTGDETARSLGIDIEKMKKLILIISSLIVAVCVANTGIIGFVGLIIPHIARIIFGPDNRVVVPFSAIFGAIFLIVCDTLARTLVQPMEMPVGAITAVFGAPFFIYLLIQGKKKVLG